MTVTAPLVVSFVVVLLVTPALRWLSHRHDVLDQPNERSSHTNPTPRGGGLAILAGLVFALLLIGRWDDAEFTAILICSSAIAVMGLLDDIITLRATHKLLMQIGAAAATLVLTQYILRGIELPLMGDLRFPFWIGVALSLFWIVGVTNAYNFMDGVNGIASIEAIVCALSYAMVFRAQGDSNALALCLALTGGAAGFLVYNASGSIFMGDVGSATLGFAFACLALRLATQGAPFIVVVLPLLPFLVDTSLTLLRRAKRRERLFSAHRAHTYQRLTDLGWSHLAVSAAYGGAAAACAAVGVAWAFLPPSLAVAAVGLIVILMLVCATTIERKVNTVRDGSMTRNRPEYDGD